MRWNSNGSNTLEDCDPESGASGAPSAFRTVYQSPATPLGLLGTRSNPAQGGAALKAARLYAQSGMYWI